MEAAGEYGPEGVQTTATPDGDGYRLRGAKTLVPYAEAAEQILVPARTGPGRTDGTLFLVDPQADGVTVEAMDNIAGYWLYAVILEDARVSAARWWAPPARSTAPPRPCSTVPGCCNAPRSSARAKRYSNSPSATQGPRPVRAAHRPVPGGAVPLLRHRQRHAPHVAALPPGRLAHRRRRAPRQRGRHGQGHASKAAQHMAHQAHEVHAGAAFMLEHDLPLSTPPRKHWEST